MSRSHRALGLLALAAAAVGVAVAICELAARVLDGQPLLAWWLPSPPAQRHAVQLRPDADAPLPSDIDPGWINVPPPPLSNKGPIDPQLLQRARTPRDPKIQPFELLRTWNSRHAERVACDSHGLIGKLPPPLLVFDPSEPNGRPPFRYPLARTLPGGLTTNRFGWRGEDIPLDKPSGTIRLAFVGASTTVGLWDLPFSYPEYVVHWLNLWAVRAGLAVRFDGINAGREGLDSTSIAAVIAQEVMPAEPDAVVYYEGANQSLCSQTDATDPLRATQTRSPSNLRKILGVMGAHSQLARRLEELALRLDARDGHEPIKPRSFGTWFKPGLDESRPLETEAALPEPERLVLASLDNARDALRDAGAVFVLSSFVWLVYDGMRLDPLRHLAIYRYLNEWCWPYRYAEVRRALNLHNRILEQYARMHDLPFIDVASAFPYDPDLFFDAIHLNSDGTRMHAWIVFRALVALVREQIASGTWPRPDRVALLEHPGIKPPRVFTKNCVATPTHHIAVPPTPPPRSDNAFF